MKLPDQPAGEGPYHGGPERPGRLVLCCSDAQGAEDDCGSAGPSGEAEPRTRRTAYRRSTVRVRQFLGDGLVEGRRGARARISPFRMFMTAVIFASSINIGIEIQCGISGAGDCEKIAGIMEFVFLGIFLLEPAAH